MSAFLTILRVSVTSGQGLFPEMRLPVSQLPGDQR